MQHLLQKMLHFYLERGQLNKMYQTDPNPSIAFMSIGSSNPLSALAVDGVFDYCFLKKGNGGTQAVSRWVYSKGGKRESNITDWGLQQFRKHYAAEKGALITDDSIFFYAYAVMHDPVYKSEFAVDLKRAFPRIRLHDNFTQWASWGKELFELHAGYENQEPFLFEIELVKDSEKSADGDPAVPRLVVKQGPRRILLDSETILSGIPANAWKYEISSRSAIEWVLQHFRKLAAGYGQTSSTGEFSFDARRHEIISLLGKVVSVSLRTVEITTEMSNISK